jgi:hypothetical protein
MRLSNPNNIGRYMSEFEELDDEIAVIRGEIWDNCRDYCRRCDIHSGKNEEVRIVKNCPNCGKVMGFIPYAGIMDYLKILSKDEREAREKGIWRHLSGLVYKKFSADHIYKDFPIPSSWTKVEAIDPHDARKTHWLFGAVSPEEIEVFKKRVNRIYFYGQLLLDGSIEDIMRNVRSFRELNGYSDPYFVTLDKKHGEKTQLEDRSWFSELQKAGLKRVRMSQSASGDVELGHKIVQAYLEAHYFAVKEKSVPGMMFAETGCGGLGGVISYMRNYQYKEGTSHPAEDFKDWCDTVRYIAMEFPRHQSEELQAKNAKVLQMREAEQLRMKRIIGSR